MKPHKLNERITLTFFLEENNNVSYMNLQGQRCGAPITNTIVDWLTQDKLEDRQVAALTRYMRRLDKVLDENFSKPDAYTSRQKRTFRLDNKLDEFIKHYQTQLWQ